MPLRKADTPDKNAKLFANDMVEHFNAASSPDKDGIVPKKDRKIFELMLNLFATGQSVEELQAIRQRIANLIDHFNGVLNFVSNAIKLKEENMSFQEYVKETFIEGGFSGIEESDIKMELLNMLAKLRDTNHAFYVDRFAEGHEMSEDEVLKEVKELRELLEEHGLTILLKIVEYGPRRKKLGRKKDFLLKLVLTNEEYDGGYALYKFQMRKEPFLNIQDLRGFFEHALREMFIPGGRTIKASDLKLFREHLNRIGGTTTIQTVVGNLTVMIDKVLEEGDDIVSQSGVRCLSGIRM